MILQSVFHANRRKNDLFAFRLIMRHVYALSIRALRVFQSVFLSWSSSRLLSVTTHLTSGVVCRFFIGIVCAFCCYERSSSEYRRRDVRDSFDDIKYVRVQKLMGFMHVLSSRNKMADCLYLKTPYILRGGPVAEPRQTDW